MCLVKNRFWQGPFKSLLKYIHYFFKWLIRLKESAFSIRCYELKFKSLAAKSNGNGKEMGIDRLVADIYKFLPDTV